jgi:hypothetical protein
MLGPRVMLGRRRRLTVRVLHGSEDLLIRVSTVNLCVLLGMPMKRHWCWGCRRRQLRATRRVWLIRTGGRVVVNMVIRALGRRRRELGRGSMRSMRRMRERVMR